MYLQNPVFLFFKCFMLKGKNMKVGVFSDTHLKSAKELPRKALDLLSSVDAIIHAGDYRPPSPARQRRHRCASAPERESRSLLL